MTGPTERDEALGRAIGQLPVPDHSPGFWDDLRIHLEASTVPPAEPSPPLGEAGQVGGGRPVGGPVQRLDNSPARSGRPRTIGIRPIQEPANAARPTRWLLAAAAVLVVVAGAGYAFSRSGDGQDVDTALPVPATTAITGVAPTTLAIPTTPAPSTTVAPSTTTRPGGGAPVTVGSPVPLGEGLVVGLSPDATVAYLSAPDPEVVAVGCEGGDWSSLFVQPVEGGPRVRVGEPGQIDANRVVPGPDGRVALLSICEEFLSQVWIGSLDGAGVPVDLRPVTLSPDPGTIAALDTLQWVADGNSLLIAGVSATGQPDGDPGAYRIDPATGRGTPIGPDGVIRADGGGNRFAALLDTGDVYVDGATVGRIELPSASDAGTSRGITDLVVTADGAVWIASRTQGVLRVEPGQPVETIDPTPTQLLVPTPAGMAWLTVATDGSRAATLRTAVAGGIEDLYTIDSAVLPTVNLGGTALAWTELSAAGDGIGSGFVLPLNPTG